MHWRLLSCLVRTGVFLAFESMKKTFKLTIKNSFRLPHVLPVAAFGESARRQLGLQVLHRNFLHKQEVNRDEHLSVSPFKVF